MLLVLLGQSVLYVIIFLEKKNESMPVNMSKSPF